MTYEQSVDYLLASLSKSGQRLGLERVERLVNTLGRPDRSFRSVHIAGTNGKGSTGAMIEAGLRASGATTGFFSSPHLSSFTERFRINGQPISELEFARCITRCRKAAEQLAIDSDGEHVATMFELTTAAAFCAFEEAGVEWAVIETGLGGRLDSTNVIEPELTVITPIAIDHAATLGPDLASIAGEKAGIFKPDAAAVVSSQTPEAREVLSERATQTAKSLTHADQAWKILETVPNSQGKYHISVEGPNGKQVTSLLGLPGAHQVENAVTATSALDSIGVATSDIAKGLASAEWPGRLEWLPTTPSTLLDAAHNPAGAGSLARFLKQFCGDQKITLIFGVSQDKAVDEMAETLFPTADRVILTRSSVARSADPETLADAVGHHGKVIETAANAVDAWTLARRDSTPSHLVVVAGSIFLVGEIRELLTQSDGGDA